MAEKITLDWNLYLEAARKTVAEGCVLLKNDNNALPLEKGCRVSVFGRIQLHYYKSGTGSGGMVNVSHVTNILDGLRESGCVSVNEKLVEIYEEWEKEHPFDNGVGWGCEPWSQEEMPLTDDIVSSAAADSDAAVVIIGRTAGEEKDNIAEKGAYFLTDTEETMLEKARKAFSRVIVVLNVGGVVDMSFVDKFSPDAVLYAWQGGMTGGSGTADVLTGKVSPSGKLTDTIAYELSDYPAYNYFGGEERNFYSEDIYVGYRYFETFAKDKVRYPFGFGLSYTTFDVKTVSAEVAADKISIAVSVTNTGKVSGKEVVQIYAECPQGKLGKPLRSLISFNKTDSLEPGDEQTLCFDIDYSYLASYDADGMTGNKSCWVLEEGTYNIYAGTDVRSAAPAVSFDLSETIVTEQLEEACAPVVPFEIMKPEKCGDSYKVSFVSAPTAKENMDEIRSRNLPTEITYTGDKGIKLADVKSGKNTLDEFTAQLSDEDLVCIVRGEGMGSPKVTPGTAAAFGGVTESLQSFGIPAGCCDDGPSGMRLDCGTKAFSLPNGTLIACTFNTELIEELFAYLSAEMNANKVECLLGPGMNIHRYVLNGRNFEYFSEDPYLTGMMACAELKGLHKYGVTGTIKHFCGNNQEKRRHFIDTIASERALREIYLRGFEMAVKLGGADSVMTTYGSLNGVWTAGNYGLDTIILRKDWGFKGITMTDWYASINEFGKPADKTNFAAMVRAQNDLYMVCPDSEKNIHGDNTAEALADGRVARGELQRSAKNICGFVMNSRAMDRLLGTAPEIEIINRPAEDTDCDIEAVEFTPMENSIIIPLDDRDSVKGTNYIFGLDLSQTGRYTVTLTGSSEMGELAQIPCSLFFTGIPVATYTFNGTGGKDVSIERESLMMSRYTVVRLNVGQNGVKLRSLRFELKTPFEQVK